jgi:uncharacterized RDD family membrane protein YckC
MNPYEAPEAALLDINNSHLEGRPRLATSGKRFVTFLIDRVATLGLVYLVASLITEFASLDIRVQLSEIPGIDYILSYIIYYLFYVVLEGTTGRSLGKFITGTKVLSSNYERASLLQIMGRSLVRLVPFEQFSILFGKEGMWHDQASNTITVDMRAPRLPVARRYLPGEKPLIIRHPPSGQPPRPQPPSPPRPMITKPQQPGNPAPNQETDS